MSAPTEQVALAALQKVQKLTGDELDEALDRQVGAAMLGIFKALAKTLLNDPDEEVLGRAVHCMVLAYLMRGEVAGKSK